MNTQLWSTRNRSHRRLPAGLRRAHALLLLSVLVLMPACTPLTPIQASVSAAVTVEDLLEDPVQDAKEQTLLEGISDVLSAPVNMLNTGLTANIAFFWSLGDLLVGNDVNFNKRAATMSGYFPVTIASPVTPPRQLLPSEMPGSPFALKR